MHRYFFIILTCVLLARLYSQESVSISGLVKDKATGSVLSGAIVRFSAHSLVDTTDAAGAFALDGEALGTDYGALHGAAAGIPVMTPGGKIQLNLNRACHVMISGTTVDGRQMYSSKEILQRGTHLISQGGQAPGVSIVRVVVDRSQYLFLQADMGYKETGGHSGSVQGAFGEGLSKRSAQLFADTIVACKTGYICQKEAVDNANVENLVIELGGAYEDGMRLLPGGTFTMGQDVIAEPMHQVTVSAFWIDTTEVTQASYIALMPFMDTIPATQADYEPNQNINWSIHEGANLPSDEVLWWDAVIYCNARSRQEGLDSVYSYNSLAMLPCEDGLNCREQVGLVIDMTKNGYRLPTEAEWEYAARAGTNTFYFWGDAYDEETIGQYAWYLNNSDTTSHPVATKKPNPWGLYDMSGNVSEWCQDWFEQLSPDPVTNPIGPLEGSGKVLRGGNWRSDFISLTSSLRAGPHPHDRYGFGDWGFRVARNFVAP
jgi:formylglycine-generating enzyme required for sulfatase activity